MFCRICAFYVVEMNSSYVINLKFYAYPNKTMFLQLRTSNSQFYISIFNMPF